MNNTIHVPANNGGATGFRYFQPRGYNPVATPRIEVLANQKRNGLFHDRKLSSRAPGHQISQIVLRDEHNDECLLNDTIDEIKTFKDTKGVKSIEVDNVDRVIKKFERENFSIGRSYINTRNQNNNFE